MNQVLIQYQDLSGYWRTINQVTNSDSFYINMALESTARQFKSRARAIDAKTGTLIDLRG